MKKLVTLILMTVSTIAFAEPAFSNPASFNIVTTQEAAHLEAEYERMVQEAIAATKANYSSTSETWIRETVTKYVNKQLTCMGSTDYLDKLECKRNKEEFTEILVTEIKKSKQ